jgi:DNA-directed RNA polymerase subunit K/omega
MSDSELEEYEPQISDIEDNEIVMDNVKKSKVSKSIVDDDDEDEDNVDDNEDDDNVDDEDEDNVDDEDEDVDDDLEDYNPDLENEDENENNDSNKSKTLQSQKQQQTPLQNIIQYDVTDDDNEDDESDDEDYLQKFDNDIRQDYILNYHPEIQQSNYDEITSLAKVIKDDKGNIIDPFHKTVPFLTKFERTRVLGMRAKQINSGSEPFIKVPQNIIEGYVIAEMELQAKALPYIIVRPIPSGKKEYWYLEDLEVIDY